MTPVAKRLSSKGAPDKRRGDPGSRQRSVLCFGELLMRFSPRPAERLFQGPTLRVHVGGAEANVAVGLVQLGHAARMLSVVPDNAPGRAAIEALRRHGVDTATVQRVAGGRLGLYFLESAAAGRAAEVTYDRAGSALSLTTLPRGALSAALSGADWLHTSGITSALGAAPRRAQRALWASAVKADVPVSFDCNFRPALWKGREAAARREMDAGLSVATVAFADTRALNMILGGRVPRALDEAAFAAQCRRAFARHPKLQQIAATTRIEHSASRHELRGLLATRAGLEVSAPVIVDPIVDRIGTGDAFAAGLLLAGLEGLSASRALALGIAACALKHSFSGDFNLATRAEIEALAAGRSTGVRR